MTTRKVINLDAHSLFRKKSSSYTRLSRFDENYTKLATLSLSNMKSCTFGESQMANHRQRPLYGIAKNSNRAMATYFG